MLKKLQNRSISLVVTAGLIVGLAVFALSRPAESDTISNGQDAELAEEIGMADVPDKVSVVDSEGNVVGWLPKQALMMEHRERPGQIRERLRGKEHDPARRIPVRDFESNQVVGHMVDDVGFVPLEEPANE